MQLPYDIINIVIKYLDDEEVSKLSMINRYYNQYLEPFRIIEGGIYSIDKEWALKRYTKYFQKFRQRGFKLKHHTLFPRHLTPALIQCLPNTQYLNVKLYRIESNPEKLELLKYIPFPYQCRIEDTKILSWMLRNPAGQWNELRLCSVENEDLELLGDAIQSEKLKRLRISGFINWSIFAPYIASSQLEELHVVINEQNAHAIAQAVKTSKIKILTDNSEFQSDVAFIPILDIVPISNLQQISLISIRTREVCDSFVKNIGNSFLKNVGLEVCAEFLDEVLEAVTNSKLESLSFPYACRDCRYGRGNHKCGMFFDSNLTILQRYINKLPVKELSIDGRSLKKLNLVSIAERLGENTSIRELGFPNYNFDNRELVQLGNLICGTRLTSISFSVKTLNKDSIAKQFAISV
ncbi:hypothetical protein HDV04_000544, partial [Boothiomyces sp. JEL0838]